MQLHLSEQLLLLLLLVVVVRRDRVEGESKRVESAFTTSKGG